MGIKTGRTQIPSLSTNKHPGTIEIGQTQKSIIIQIVKAGTDQPRCVMFLHSNIQQIIMEIQSTNKYVVIHMKN